MTKQEEDSRRAELRKLEVHPDMIDDIIKGQKDTDAYHAAKAKEAEEAKKAAEKAAEKTAKEAAKQ